MLGALAKFGMGMVHGDGNTRQCMATAVTAYKQSFGFDAPPYTYDDFEESDVIVLVGSNLCIAHPIMWERVLRNPNAPAIIVVDPRKTETAMAATRTLRRAAEVRPHAVLRPREPPHPARAGSTATSSRRTRPASTSSRAHVAPFTARAREPATGLSPEEIVAFAERIHAGKRVSFWWTMGVNQSHEAVRTAQAIINLALMTGNIGRPGTGANSITGQCNAMGSRLFSNTTNLLGGHDFTSAEHRDKVAGILGIAVETHPGREQPGLRPDHRGDPAPARSTGCG